MALPQRVSYHGGEDGQEQVGGGPLLVHSVSTAMSEDMIKVMAVGGHSVQGLHLLPHPF